MKDNVFTYIYIYIYISNFEKNLYVSLMHFLNGKIKFIFFPTILELCWFLWEIYFSLPIFKLEFLQVNDVGHGLATEQKQQQWCCRKGFHLEGTLIYGSSHLNCISLPLSICLWLLWTQKWKGKNFHHKWVNDKPMSELFVRYSSGQDRKRKDDLNRNRLLLLFRQGGATVGLRTRLSMDSDQGGSKFIGRFMEAIRERLIRRDVLGILLRWHL